MTNPELLPLEPCPFCGCISIATRGFVCVCRDCGASTADNYTEEEAIKAWNSRTPLPTQKLEIDYYKLRDFLLKIKIKADRKKKKLSINEVAEEICEKFTLYGKERG